MSFVPLSVGSLIRGLSMPDKTFCSKGIGDVFIPREHLAVHSAFLAFILENADTINHKLCMIHFLWIDGIDFSGYRFYFWSLPKNVIFKGSYIFILFCRSSSKCYTACSNGDGVTRGTLGGAIEREPVTLKCGNLMWGKEIFIPEKKPLIASTTDFTLFFAASIGVVIADFIPFHTEVAVDLIPLNTEDTVLFTELNTEDTLLLIPSTTVVIAVLMPFHTVVATLFIALNTVVTTVFTAFTTVVTCVLIAFQTVVKVCNQ